MFSDRVHAPLSAIYSKGKVCYSVGSHQAFHRNDGITGRRVGYFEASGPGVKHIYHGATLFTLHSEQHKQNNAGCLNVCFAFC